MHLLKISILISKKQYFVSNNITSDKYFDVTAIIFVFRFSHSSGNDDNYYQNSYGWRGGEGGYGRGGNSGYGGDGQGRGGGRGRGRGGRGGGRGGWRGDERGGGRGGRGGGQGRGGGRGRGRGGRGGRGGIPLPQDPDRPRPPPHLRGREIGMWHAMNSRGGKAKRAERDIEDRAVISFNNEKESEVGCVFYFFSLLIPPL